MWIICGRDMINVSKIVDVKIKNISRYELGLLEKEYHGDYHSSGSNHWFERKRFTQEKDASPHSNIGSYNYKFKDKIETILNKYWYEISLSLSNAKPNNKANGKYASQKKSSFCVSVIDGEGDAEIIWKFKVDYGFNAVNAHVFGDSESTLSLATDVIPVIRELSEEKIKLQYKEDNWSSLFDFVMNPLDSLRNDERRKTPKEMIVELKAICKEYDGYYGKIREKRNNEQIRMNKREEFFRKYNDKSILTINMGNETKKYLEDYCDFDIFAKKQQIEKALEDYRKERKAKIETAKADFAAKITADFYEQDLLSVSILTNKEKIKEYSNVREFCYKYIPALNERDFSIDTIYENFSEYVDEEACNVFKENWIRINKVFNVLRRGEMGEEKVYEVLRLFDDRIRIFRDYIWGCEHDFIILTPYGISTIEVKNLRGNYVLTETGILKCLSNSNVKSKDIALQSKKHLETLRRNLSGCSAFARDIPLQEIICSAESNFTIKDEYHYIPVCYYNTIDKALFPENGKVVLNEEIMNKIEAYLLENKQAEFKFDVFLPRGEVNSRTEFIKSFAEVASGFMASQAE